MIKTKTTTKTKTDTNTKTNTHTKTKSNTKTKTSCRGPGVRLLQGRRAGPTELRAALRRDLSS